MLATRYEDLLHEHIERQRAFEHATRTKPRYARVRQQSLDLDDARLMKAGYDVYNSTEFVYDNYRLVKSGLTISRAFRLTMPTFVIGLIVEEIIWAIVEEILKEDSEWSR